MDTKQPDLPITARFIGGPLHRQTLSLRAPMEIVSFRQPARSDTYFLVRFTRTRLLLIHESLSGRIADEAIEGRRNPRIGLHRYITDHPSLYKVCGGCESILESASNAPFCPICHSYRFESGAEHVQQQALASRDQRPSWRDRT